jgi:N-acetylmuramoyl-L-alanine amidase
MRVKAAVIALLGLAIAPPDTFAADIIQARAWSDAGKTRVVLELTEPVTPTVFELSNPRRLVVDLPEVGTGAVLGASIDLTGSPIRAVRTGQHRNKARLVLDLAGPVQIKHFQLAPHQGQPDRLVLDLTHMENRQASETVAGTNTTGIAAQPSGRDIIVVIDAGHGGKDPGAIGANGTYEKDVVLAIARQLKERLDAIPGFEGELTRKGDIFLSLRERTRIARDLSADFFVSVHADAATRKSAQGSSIYALSTSGASSETASWLASQQNRALLGGEEEHIALADTDPVLRSVLLDLAMGVTLTESITVGDRMLAAIGQVNRLHKPRVEQAGFVVLKSPDIPSLLVETGFITNAQEEQRLKDPAHQSRLTDAILDGLVGYFHDGPPPGTWLAQQQTRVNGDLLTVSAEQKASTITIKSEVYQIQEGDTLATISEALGVPMEKLQAENPVGELPLQAGATLQLPVEAGNTGT